MRVVVTGSEGYLGRFVVDEASRRGWVVVPIDVKLRTSGCCSVFDDSFRSAIDGCEAVIHLAGVPTPDNVTADEVLRINTAGVYSVLNAAVGTTVTRVVVPSSNSVYGSVFGSRVAPTYLPVDEHHPIRPSEPYSLSKALAEHICSAMAHIEHTPSTVILRLPLVWHEARPDAETFLRAAHTAATGWFTYVHAEDAAAAMCAAAICPAPRTTLVNLSAPDTLADIPSAAVVERFFADVPILSRLEGRSTLIDRTLATALLGVTPAISWCDRR